jgi:prepilin-type processing-associated H-X9-DG protein
LIRSLAAIPDPAGTIAIAEGYPQGTIFPQQDPFRATDHWWVTENDSAAYLAWLARVKYPDTWRSQPWFMWYSWYALYQHSDGSNYVFADGHAKWLTLEATLRPRQAASPTGNLWTWDKDTYSPFR